MIPTRFTETNVGDMFVGTMNSHVKMVLSLNDNSVALSAFFFVSQDNIFPS